MIDQPNGALAILRRREVEARCGLRKSTLYAEIAQGKFPAPVRITRRSVGWVASEVDEWIARRIADSRKGA